MNVSVVVDLDVDFDGDGNVDLAAHSSTLQVGQRVSGQVAVALKVHVHVCVQDYVYDGFPLPPAAQLNP